MVEFSGESVNTVVHRNALFVGTKTQGRQDTLEPQSSSDTKLGTVFTILNYGDSPGSNSDLLDDLELISEFDCFLQL